MKRKLIVIFLMIIVAAAAGLVGCNSKDVNVDSIEISSKPVTVYVQGDSIDLTGGQLLVRYEDSTEELIPITESMLSTFDSDIIGRQILQVSYKGKKASLELIVVAPEVDTVELYIDEGLFKSQYIEEQDISPDGLSLTITYKGGVTRTKPVTRDMITGYNAEKTGTQKVFVRYEHKEDVFFLEFNVNVSPKELTGIEVSVLPSKLVYYVGDPIDLTGGKLFLRYNNGYPKVADMKTLVGLTVSWNNMTVTNNSTVTLTYGEKTTKFNISVIVKDITEFNVKQMPAAVQLVNTPLNLDGLVIEVVYTNGQKETFSVPEKNVYYQDRVSEDIPYSIYAYGYNTSAAGPTTVKLGFYSGGVLLNTRYDLIINVADKSISDIAIFRTDIFDSAGNPVNEKTVYTHTGFRPFEDWSYSLIFDNGERSAPAPLLRGMVVGSGNTVDFSFTTPGTVTWEIEYQDDNYVYDGIYSFEVIALAIAGTGLAEMADGAYAEKDFLKVFLNSPADTAGTYLKLTYNSGDTDYIPLTQDMILYDEFENDKLTTVNMPIRIQLSALSIDHNTVVPVVVVKKVEGSLGVSKLPSNTNYILYNPSDITPENRHRYFFNYNGLEITLTYEGESQTTKITDFSNGDWQFTCAEWTSPETYGKFYSVGRKTVYITYIGLENPGTQGVAVEVFVTNNVTEISFDQPNLGSVFAGAMLTVDGLTITVYYENGIYKEVSLTSDMLDYDPRDTDIGLRSVGIYYSEGGETYSCFTTVTVIQNGSYGIEIFKLPDTLEYIIGQAQTLDRTGMVVNLLYKNGTRTILKQNEYICENFSSAELGEVMITVRYLADESYTATFFVYIVEAVVTSIVWENDAPVVVIQEGVDFTVAGARTNYNAPLSSSIIRLYYSDGTTTTSELGTIIADLEVRNYNKYSAVTQYVELVYKNRCVLTVETDVNARTLTGISSETGSFYVIEYSDLDLSSAKLRLVFDNGLSENTVPLLKEYLVYDPVKNPDGYDKNDTELGWRNVKVIYSYNGAVCETVIAVNVIAKELQAIGMKNLPKVKYIEGENLDLSGGTVVLFYNNGTTDELNLANATVNVSNSTFNVNSIRFDNSEFSGLSKLQTIYVNYIWNGAVFETDFDIIMQDRKYLQVNFNSNNIYEFFYGDLNASSLPTFTVLGYSIFTDSERNMTLDNSKFTVEYIRYEERFLPKDPGKDYTAVPREVGEYLIVISYDSALYGDMVHNSFITAENETRIITIRKKKIYIELADISKIYGTANPVFNIVAYGTDSAGLKSLTAPAFAFDEDFLSPYFADQTVNYGLSCYDSLGRAVNYVKISAYNEDRVLVTIGDASPAGSYLIYISGITSINYDIVYETSSFVIEKRKVAVIPDSVTAVYGTTSLVYNYTTAKVYDEHGVLIQDSGLYEEDVLTGALNRMDEDNNSVGLYKIILGTLQNPNYQIVFNPGGEDKYVNIVKRNIYVKADSLSKIFGEDVPEFSLEYFRDETCLDTNAFAFSADREAGLGIVSFNCPAQKLSGIGDYAIAPLITKDTEGGNNVYDNYNIIYINGVLKILPRRIIVTADAGSKTYGENDPAAFTYTVTAVPGMAESGLVIINAYGDLDTLIGALSRQPGEYVGRYAITIGTLQSMNPNYDITYNRADFVINKKQIYMVISENDLTKTYDGRQPSLDSFEISHEVDGVLVPYTDPRFNVSSISVGFENPSRNAGSYYIVIQNSDVNYNVSFPSGVTYFYTIEPLVVDIEYVGLPDGMQYKGAAYTFSARVPDIMLQKVYNPDGSPKTDDNNQEIKDVVEVTLSPVNARDAGTYTVYPLRLSDTNYRLSAAAQAAVPFTIVRRELVVEMITGSDGITCESVYDNQPAVLFEGTHYTVTNTIPDMTVNLSVRVLNPLAQDPYDMSVESPKDVRYDTDGVTILSYDVIADAPSNKNFNLSLKKEYKFKILPRKVNIVIFESTLTKEYDAKMPSIDPTMFYITDTTGNLSPSSFNFSFISADPLRGNGDVGTYEIVINCTDKNHIVTALGDKVYVYTIVKRTVNVEVNSSALIRMFNGEPAIFTTGDLTIRNSVGQLPYIKNYTDDAYIAEMQAVYDDLRNRTISYQSQINSISFTDKNYARMLCVNAINAAIALYNEYQSALSLKHLQPANQSGIITSIGDPGNPAPTSLIGRLNQIIALIDSENYNPYDAQALLNLVIQIAASVYRMVDSEQNYIGFKFTGIDPFVTSVGSYAVSMIYHDHNKRYNFLNGQSCILTIKPWVITVKTESVISSVYGEPVPSEIPYTTWDGDTQVFLDDIQGSIVVDVSFDMSGENPYAAGIFDLKPNQAMSINPNYTIYYNLGVFVVNQAEITIKINKDIGTELDPYGKIYYGDSISPQRLKQWTAEGLRAPQPGGTVDPISVIFDSTAVFNCYDNNGVSVTQISAQPAAGTYDVTGSGFISRNYSFVYETGALTINKKALHISTSNGILYRPYGSEIIFNYNGFVYGQNTSVLGTDYVKPVPVNPSSPAFQVTTPASDTVTYIERFTMPEGYEDQFPNYYIELEDVDYVIMITKADLIMTLVGTGPNGSLTAVYGSEPVHQIVYEGFKNNDEAIFSNIHPILDFKKGVSNLDDFTEYNVTFDTSTFSAQELQAYNNYRISVTDVPYTVTKKTLEIYLAAAGSSSPLTINAMYGTESPYIGPYKAEYEYSSEGALTKITVTGGQYWLNNIYFRGLEYGEDPADIFVKFPDNESYFEYDSLFKHTLVYDMTVGINKTIKLDEFEFFTPEDANYELVYIETPLNIYSKVQSLKINGDLLMLEGDDPDTFPVIAVTEALTEIEYTLNDSYFVSKNFTNYPSATDVNGSVTVTYARSYTVNGYTGPSSAREVSVNSTIATTINNGDVIATLPVRIHKRTSTVYDATLMQGSNAYVFGSEINAPAPVSLYDGNGVAYHLKNYDRIDTSVRFSPISRSYSYRLLINGDSSLNNSLYLVFAGAQGAGAVTLAPVVGGVPAEAIPLTFGEIDIFDGYTHNIRLYYNKFTNTVYIMLDGYMTQAVSIDPGVYTATENSMAGFTASGVKAYVRHFELAKQGYADNLGTLVRTEEGQNVIIHTSSATSTAAIALADFFSIKEAPAPGYSLHYYFDGENIANCYYDDNESTMRAGVAAGVHKGELVVKFNDVVYSKYSIRILVTPAAVRAYLTDGGVQKDVSPLNPVPVYSYTRTDINNPDDLTMQNSVPAPVNYPLTANGGEANYRSVSVSFTMDRATYNGAYRANPTDNFLKLATNAAEYNPSIYSAPETSYYGITLGMRHIRETENSSYYNTTLYVSAAGCTFYSVLPGNIMWGDGSVYTVELYFDYIGSLGGNSFKLIILRDNVSILDLTVDVDYEFGNAIGTTLLKIPYGLMQMLMTSTGRKAAFYATDNKITFFKLAYGGEKAFDYNYLVNGVYREKSAAGNTLGSKTAPGTSVITLSDDTGNPHYAYYNNILLQFSAEKYQSGADNLTFYIASSESQLTFGRGIALIYNGTNNTLYFTFYNRTANFALQKVVTKDLMDGAPHTIMIRINRAAVQRATTIVHATNTEYSVYGGNTPVNINRVYITVDGIEYSTNANYSGANPPPLCIPYYNRMDGWYYRDNNGIAPPGETLDNYPNFLKSYNYSSAYVKNALMTVYNYQVNYGPVTDHIGSQAGAPITGS